MGEKKLKILFLISHCGQGGDWVVVKTTARNISAESAEFWLNGTRWEHADTPPDEGPIKLNQGWREYLRVGKTGEALPRDLDIIHAHSPAAILMALLIRFWHTPKAKIVFTFHWPTPDRFLRKLAKKWLFSQVSQIHCPSLGIVDALVRSYSVPQSKCSLVYLGVESDRFKSMPVEDIIEKRRAIGWDRENTVIGYLGRFDREKNVSWLIRFMREQSGQFPALRLVLFGGGALKNALLSESEDLIAKGRVHFAGYTRSPEEAYPIMDLHVLPSSFEAFALTVVEAAYCGVPTLRTNVEGAIDQIEDNVDGFISDIGGGYTAFAEKLVDVLNNYMDQLPDMGAASRVKLQRLCAVEAFGKHMSALYQNLPDR